MCITIRGFARQSKVCKVLGDPFAHSKAHASHFEMLLAGEKGALIHTSTYSQDASTILSRLLCHWRAYRSEYQQGEEH